MVLIQRVGVFSAFVATSLAKAQESYPLYPTNPIFASYPASYPVCSPSTVTETETETATV